MVKEDKPTTEELTERRDALLRLKEAIENRLASASKEEKIKVEALSKRAINPECTFDQKHREQLYALALFPSHVGWYFKLRERLHRLFHHH